MVRLAASDVPCICRIALVEIVKENSVTDAAPLSQIKVIAYKEKGEWTLESKYNIGKKRQPSE